ncbi:MAG TPA: hypothetical protein VD887_13715 [Allosphingosinicella sp.]|nr:hypothetical protein [Allosphingosinicella sp.]HYG31258.1 hypothetical protein [Allosphingosinicella sp.]
MRILVLAAGLAAAVAIPSTASAQRWGYGSGYGHGYGQRYNSETSRELRECRRELRRADSRREYRAELRECRRELRDARYDDRRRGYHGRSHRGGWGYRDRRW